MHNTILPVLCRYSPLCGEHVKVVGRLCSKWQNSRALAKFSTPQLCHWPAHHFHASPDPNLLDVFNFGQAVKGVDAEKYQEIDAIGSWGHLC